MKFRQIILSAAVLGFSFTASANTGLPLHMENSLVSVCKSSLTNRPISFKKTMRENGVNPQRILPNLVCNGESIHDFALNRGADRVAERIKRYTPGDVTIQDLAMNQRIEVFFEE